MANLNVLEILKSLKLKATEARIAIIETFASSEVPLSVEMIAHKIKGKKVNQVTIYRTIESLLKADVISRVDLRQGSVFYELNNHHGHHHHIVCTECGFVEDFESCQIESLSTKILSQSKRFKKINDHSFELFGVCNMCIKKNE